jgi:membrane associated rhomboid family serine protease
LALTQNTIAAPVVLAIFAVIAASAIVAGAVLLGGLAWGLIIGGMLVLAAVIVLYDPDTKRRRKSR